MVAKTLSIINKKHESGSYEQKKKEIEEAILAPKTEAISVP